MTTAQELDKILRGKHDGCPHAKRCNDIDYCDINDKPCLLESGLQCEEWQEIQEEWAKETSK